MLQDLTISGLVECGHAYTGIPTLTIRVSKRVQHTYIIIYSERSMISSLLLYPPRPFASADHCRNLICAIFLLRLTQPNYLARIENPDFRTDFPPPPPPSVLRIMRITLECPIGGLDAVAVSKTQYVIIS